MFVVKVKLSDTVGNEDSDEYRENQYEDVGDEGTDEDDEDNEDRDDRDDNEEVLHLHHVLTCCQTNN